jgi:hypothetical protein
MSHVPTQPVSNAGPQQEGLLVRVAIGVTASFALGRARCAPVCECTRGESSAKGLRSAGIRRRMDPALR